MRPAVEVLKQLIVDDLNKLERKYQQETNDILWDRRVGRAEAIEAVKILISGYSSKKEFQNNI